MGWGNKITGMIPARYVLCFMFFVGFMVAFLLRVNINIAIVAMANAAQNSEHNEHSNSSCTVDVNLGLISNDNIYHTHKLLQTSRVPQIQELPEFDWDEVQQSFILSSYFWGYLIFQIPGGRVAEVFGTKRVFGLSILVGGMLSILLPIAAALHWKFILLIRALQGLSQGVIFPAMSASVVRWVPLEERARFVAFAVQGASLGTVFSLPLCGWILTHWGWPAVFYVSGVLAILWYLAWGYLVYDSPQQHPRISLLERQYLEANLDQRKYGEVPSVPWISVLTSFQFWMGVIPGLGNDWGFHTFCTFVPKYMKSALGFDLSQSSLVSSLPFLSQYIFAMIYGTFADLLLRAKVKLIHVRKLSVVVSHLFPAAGMVVLSYLGCDIFSSVLVLTLSVTFIGAMSSGFFQNPLDIAPNYAGSLTGVTNAIGSLTAVISTPLAGYILQENPGTNVGWHIIFCIAAAMYAFSSLPYLLFATAQEEPWNDLRNKRRRKKTLSLKEVVSDDREPAEQDILTIGK